MTSDDKPLTGWASTTLGDIASVPRSKVIPSSENSQPFIGLEHIEANTMRLLGSVPFSSMKSQGVQFEPGDVLYSRLRPYLNKVFRPNFAGVCSAEFIVFSESCAVDTRFLQYVLNSAAFVSFASHLNSGDRPRVDLQQIAPFPINLPPKVEQCRIADAIEEDIAQLDAAIRRMQVAKKKLTAFRASVLQSTGEGRLVPTEAELSQRHKDTNLADRPYETGTELLARILKERRERWEEEEVTKFAADLRCKLKNTQNDALSTDADKSRELAIAAKISEFRCDNKWKLKYREPTPPETSNLPALPRDWAWATLGQVAHVQGGIQKQPSRMPKAYRFPFLRVANVKRGTLDLKEVHEVELFGIGELDKLRLTKGDLLIVEGNGSPSEIGRMAIWTGEIRDCVHQNHIIRSRLSSGVLPEYVEAFWNSPAGSKAVQGQSSSTTGLHTLSVSKVGAIPIPLPPTTEQYRIVESVSRAMLEADQATNVITRLELRADALRQSILKIAFAGKLVPQYPSEEPALALLDRLESLALNLRSGSKRASKQSKSKKAAPVSNETIPTSL